MSKLSGYTVMSKLIGYTVYNIYRKKDDGYRASFFNQRLCHEYMKMKKEAHFFEIGSMEEAEEEYGPESYHIGYSFALTQENTALWWADFSGWN